MTDADKELRELAEKATAEPWIHDDRGGCTAVRTGTSNGLDGDCKDLICFSRKEANFDGHYWDMDGQTRKNFAYIAAAHPARIIELLNRVEKLDKVMDAIKKYHPGHHNNCNYVVSDYEGKCDCGFREFQRAVQEAAK